MFKTYLFLLFTITILSLSGYALGEQNSVCHNATGTCYSHGFVCANEEVISHNMRCNGVEDCADGTDEYMCDQSSTPIHALKPNERFAQIEVSCIKCTCLKGSITIASSNTAWFKIALTSPRDFTMMTDAPSYGNKPCNSATGATTSIQLNVYKKQNKGCRGWVCCFRQERCVSCGTGSPASHCY
jgi:hypothetical protein